MKRNVLCMCDSYLYVGAWKGRCGWVLVEVARIRREGTREQKFLGEKPCVRAIAGTSFTYSA